MRSALAVAALIASPGVRALDGEEPVLKLRVSAVETPARLSIELLRWSTEAERAPMLAALSAPPPAASTGRGAPAAGRGGRGAAPPPSPLARLTAAIKASPTIGFIWGDGPTGYSIKYAWRSESAGGAERLVLVTDRRLGSHVVSQPQPTGASADAEFTVIEARIDGKGTGEARTSLASPAAVGANGTTLALENYADAPVQFKVTR
jgi:hypothetical protein